MRLVLVVLSALLSACSSLGPKADLDLDPIAQAVIAIGNQTNAIASGVFIVPGNLLTNHHVVSQGPISLVEDGRRHVRQGRCDWC